MDPWIIGTAALTGIGSIVASVITGVLVGRFGVRTALKQFSMQRGFERQLDWYEKTAQAILEFRNLNAELAFAVEMHDGKLFDEKVKRAMTLVEQLLKTLDDSVLYADRAIFLLLRELATELRRSSDFAAELKQKGAVSAQPFHTTANLLH